MNAAATTDPIDAKGVTTAPRLAIQPAHKDPNTGALWVHKDLVQVQQAWAEEAHLGPVDTREGFGDVESWVAYVQQFASDTRPPLLTWSSQGLHAVLDYHLTADDPGRCDWVAHMPFETSVQWKAWMALANGQARGQKQAIELLEDRGGDIVEPAQAPLMELLRSLRTTVNANANASLREDGSTSVSFSTDASVRGGKAGDAVLPSEIKIEIPVLKGHLDADGKMVVYRISVRLRVSVDESAHLALRFSIPDAELLLDKVYADRVASAKVLLGPELPILRAAG